jgi:hypothetical protein
MCDAGRMGAHVGAAPHHQSPLLFAVHRCDSEQIGIVQITYMVFSSCTTEHVSCAPWSKPGWVGGDLSVRGQM